MRYIKKKGLSVTVLRRNIVVLTALVFMHCMSFAQQNNNYFFKHLTREDGLLHSNVYDIAEDKKGFIWIATSNGLQRYDGNSFLNFNDMLNDPALSVAGAATLCVDKDSNYLWIRKSGNLEKFDVIKKQYTLYKPAEIVEQFFSHGEKYHDQNDIPYVLSDKFILSYDSTTKKINFLAFNSKPSCAGFSGDFVTNTTTGETWICSNTSGLALLDKKNKQLYTTRYNPNHNSILFAFAKVLGKQVVPIRKVMLDSENNLWVATWGSEFYKYDASQGKLFSYSLLSVLQNTKGYKYDNAPLAVNSFFEDDHHITWASTENAGLLRYDKAANNFVPIFINAKVRSADPYNYNIYCIFQDARENFWLGTDKGITVFNPYSNYFTSVHHEEGNAASLPKSEIECCIQAANGNILVGTWGGGITVYNSTWHFKNTIRFSGPFELNLIWCFAQNDDGTIWAGCQHGYIHIYNPVDNTVHTINPPELGNYTVRCMAKDSNGNIWLGLHNGKVAEWNKQENKFYAYNDSMASPVKLFSPVTNIFFDKQQHCFISSEAGMRELDTRKRIFTAQYLPVKSDNQSVAAYTVQGMEQYNDSTVIMGTIYGGLDLFNIKNKTFSQVTFNNDARVKNIYAVKKDKEGFIWLTSDFGFFSFKPGDKNVTQYNIQSGLVRSAFKSLYFFPLLNSEWVTFTATDIITFNPSQILHERKESAKVEITGFKIFDTPFGIDSLLEAGKPVELTYQQNFITIDFARPGFSALHENNYSYRLKGLNNTWVNAESKLFATYTNLAPGKYTFEVGVGDNGKGYTQFTSFEIIIAPPFWKTWWFITIVSILIAILLYKLIQWRIKSIQAVEKEKGKVQEAKIEMLSMSEKLMAARLEALRSQMNPHFIFNCLTSIDNLIQTGEKEKATTYLARFAKLIRATLETSKSNTIPCWKDLEMLTVYLEMEELRCDKKFTYEVKVADEIMNGDYKVPPLIIQPFVENAIHHGLLNKKEKNKHLLIEVTASQNEIHYTILDNGIGRERAAEYRRLNKPAHISMGMQITIDRIHLFDQHNAHAVFITDLYDEHRQPSGTKVEINLMNQS